MYFLTLFRRERFVPRQAFIKVIPAKNTRPIKKDGCCKYFNKNRAKKPYYTNLTGKTRYKRSSAESDGVTTQG